MTDIALKTLRKLREELDAPESALAKSQLPTHSLGLGVEVPDSLEKKAELDKGASPKADADLPTHKLKEDEDKEEDKEDEKLDEVKMSAEPRVDGEKAAKDSLHPEDASHGSKLPAQPSELSPDEIEKKLDECEACDEEEDEKSKKELEESIKAIFSKETNLSEELKQETVTLFEAAVHMRVKDQTKRIQGLYEARLKKETARISAQLIESLDLYLNSIVEGWLEENKLAVESGLEAELAESLLSDVRGVFTKHNVDLPKEKVDLFAKLAQKAEILEGKLNAEITHSAELSKKLSDVEKREAIREASKGLSEVEADKMETLAEGVKYEGRESFAKKLLTLKESFLSPKDAPAEKNGVELLVEGGIEKEEGVSLINEAAKSISRQVAKK
jgi:hypothetical protein